MAVHGGRRIHALEPVPGKKRLDHLVFERHARPELAIALVEGAFGRKQRRPRRDIDRNRDRSPIEQQAIDRCQPLPGPAPAKRPAREIRIGPARKQRRPTLALPPGRLDSQEILDPPRDQCGLAHPLENHLAFLGQPAQIALDVLGALLADHPGHMPGEIPRRPRQHRTLIGRRHAQFEPQPPRLGARHLHKRALGRHMGKHPMARQSGRLRHDAEQPHHRQLRMVARHKRGSGHLIDVERHFADAHRSRSAHPKRQQADQLVTAMPIERQRSQSGLGPEGIEPGQHHLPAQPGIVLQPITGQPIPLLRVDSPEPCRIEHLGPAGQHQLGRPLPGQRAHKAHRRFGKFDHATRYSQLPSRPEHATTARAFAG